MSQHAEDAPHLLEVEERPTAVVRGNVPMSGLKDFFDHSFSALGASVAGQPGVVTGAAFARYNRPPGATADLEVGFPVSRVIEPAGNVVPGSLPGGRVVQAVHVGGYDGLSSSWERLVSWAEEQGLTRSPVLWEVYLTEPTPDGDASAMRTELNWLLE